MTRTYHPYVHTLHALAYGCRGQGIARQRQAIITGLRDSVKEFDVDGINNKDGRSKEVTITHWSSGCVGVDLQCSLMMLVPLARCITVRCIHGV